MTKNETKELYEKILNGGDLTFISYEKIGEVLDYVFTIGVKEYMHFVYKNNCSYLRTALYRREDILLILYYLAENYDERLMNFVANFIKDNECIEVYEVIAEFWDRNSVMRLIESCHKIGLEFPNVKMIDVAFKNMNSDSRELLFINLVASYTKPSERVYKLVYSHAKSTEHDGILLYLLDSINAPFDYIFAELVKKGDLHLMELNYQKWVEQNDFRAFLFEEFVYINNIEVDFDLRERKGLISSTILANNFINYFLILNYWSMDLKGGTKVAEEHKQFLSLYKSEDNSKDLMNLLNNLEFAMSCDQNYLEITQDMRHENKKRSLNK